jgi:MFS family permease
MFATTLAVLADAFPEPAERARAFAAYGASIGGSFAVGPLVGGALTSGLGWSAIFFLNVPIGAACIAVTLAAVRESRDPHPRPVDMPGQAVLTGGLFLLIFALLRGNVGGWGSAPIVAALVGSGVLLAGFVLLERRRPHAMLPLALFRNGAFAGAQVAAFAISASFFAVFFYLSLYLQLVRHLSPIGTGLVYLPASTVIFIVSGASAKLLERRSPQFLIGAGLNLVSIGLGVCTIAGTHSSWAALLPGTLLAGVGTGLFNPAMSALALGSVDARQSGLAAGTNDTFRNVGIAVGIAALGALMPAHAVFGRGSSTAFITGFHRALLVTSIVAGIGSGAAVALIRRGKTPRRKLTAAEVAPSSAKSLAGAAA